MWKRLQPLGSYAIEVLALLAFAALGAALVFLPYHPNLYVSITATTVFIIVPLALSVFAINPWLCNNFNLPAANFLSKAQLFSLRGSIVVAIAAAFIWLIVVWFSAAWATYLFVYVLAVALAWFSLIGLMYPIYLAISAIRVSFVEKIPTPQVNRFSQIVTTLDFIVLGLIAFLMPLLAYERLVEFASHALIGAA